MPMKKLSRKSVITLPILCVMLFALTSCGNVKSASELEKYAEKTYGACEIISKSETDDRTELILHDKLQDFDYSIESVMNSVNVDGGIWGKYADIHSGFEGSLKDKVIQNVTDKLYSECKCSNARWEKEDWLPGLIRVYAGDEVSAKEAALFCAEILQSENLKNRMDGWEIRVYVGGEQTGEERIGTITLPVTLYFFRASDGSEYYLCDFLYYEGDSRDAPKWYTNYGG